MVSSDRQRAVSCCRFKLLNECPIFVPLLLRTVPEYLYRWLIWNSLEIINKRYIGDEDHPYGYGFETYVWSMISAVGSFFLGAGASVYHGLSNLADALHSPTVISQLESTSAGVMEFPSDGMMSQSELLVASAPVALGVLSIAGIIESYTALVAWSELQREAKAAGFSSTKVRQMLLIPQKVLLLASFRLIFASGLCLRDCRHIYWRGLIQ